VGQLSINSEKLKFLFLKFMHCKSGIACQIDREYNEYTKKSSNEDDNENNTDTKPTLLKSPNKDEESMKEILESKIEIDRTITLNPFEEKKKNYSFSDYMNRKKIILLKQLNEFCSQAKIVSSEISRITKREKLI
jgi:hypothetical protein